MSPHCRVLTALTAVAMVSLPGAALAALPQQSGGLDLLTQSQGRVDGATAGEVFGENLAGAGDVNGDGIGDVIVGSGTRNAAVVFGDAAFGTLDSAALGSRGFRIVNSPTAYPYHVVSGAGDQNGDGKADVLIGEETTNKAYLIFGKADSTTVNPSSLGSGGVTFTGASTTPSVGMTADMNGDGKPEVLVSDPTATFNARATAGIAYVIFSGAFTPGSSIALANVGASVQGFQIGGPVAGHNTGSQIAGAGDFNGDGKGDVLVADEGAGNNGRGGSGSVYVVFGKNTTTAVDLNAAGPLRIDGQAASDGLGRSLSPAGDVNGDGRADVVVGSSFADNAGSSSGSAWVVFGNAAPPATIDTAAIGTAGYRIDGVAAGDQAARSLGGGADLNGDGASDIVIGALFADPLSRADAGAFYVVYGKATNTTVALGSLGSGGYHVDAALAGDTLGRGVAMVGDVTGDGRADAMGGAEFADPTGRANGGMVYLALGFGPASFSLAAGRTVTAGTAIDPLLPTTVKRTGTPTWSVTPALPAGVTVDTATGTVSGTPTTAQASTGYTLTMTDLSGTASQPFTLQVDAAPVTTTPPTTAPPTTTPPTTTPPAKPANVKRPAISGTARAGRTLRCSRGTWTGSPTLKVRWLRSGKAIPGATKASYKVLRRDRHKLLACRVRASNAAGSASRTSVAKRVR